MLTYAAHERAASAITASTGLKGKKMAHLHEKAVRCQHTSAWRRMLA
jgi:hypothetical protein